MADMLKFAHLPGIVQWFKEIFPNGATEPKTYLVDGYTLRHGPLNMKQDKALMALIKDAGGREWSDFLTSTLVGTIETLLVEGFIHNALEIILEFEDRSIVHRWVRKSRMFFTRTTKADVILEMDNLQIGHVIADFFSMNFSSMLKSSDTSGSTTSSSPKTEAKPATAS